MTVTQRALKLPLRLIPPRTHTGLTKEKPIRKPACAFDLRLHLRKKLKPLEERSGSDLLTGRLFPKAEEQLARTRCFLAKCSESEKHLKDLGALFLRLGPRRHSAFPLMPLVSAHPQAASLAPATQKQKIKESCEKMKRQRRICSFSRMRSI